MADGEVGIESEDVQIMEPDEIEIMDSDEVQIIEPDLTQQTAETKKEEGNQLYKTKNYTEALLRYSEAIELCSDCAAYYGNRSACYMMLGMYKQALEDARKSVVLDKKFVKGYIRVAKCYIILGDTVAAQNVLSRVEEIEPGNPSVASERRKAEVQQRLEDEAMTAYEKKDYRKALYCLERTMDQAISSRRLMISKAECLAFLGRYQESQEIANGVLYMDSLNADAVYVRGLCLYYQDNIDKAFSHFQQVLRLAPDHQKSKAIYKKARLLKQKKEEGNEAFKAGNLTAAYDLYTEALSIDPQNKFTNAKLYFNRATVCSKINKLNQTIEDCTKAIELDENYLKAYMRRAKGYMDMEQYEEAVRDYEHIFSVDKSRENKRLLQEAKLAQKKSQRKDYYKILGVDKNATEDEIKKAYRKRALVHHPDRHANATVSEKQDQEKKFKEVGEAYSVLSDGKKRSRYDNGQDLEDMEGFPGDIDAHNIFQAFFSGPGGASFNINTGGMGGFGGGGYPGGFMFQFG